jgi:23S rRNA pseudouridine2457 synthase
MTAHVGFPTLRLIRHKIGPWTINNIAPGNYGESQVFLPENTSKNKQNKNQYGSKKPSSSRNATKRSKRKNTS